MAVSGGLLPTLDPEDVHITSSSSSTLAKPTKGQSSLSSSPRQLPAELSSPILEEECDETESEPANEPVTPVSGRQSHDFQHALQNHELHRADSNSVNTSISISETTSSITPKGRVPLTLSTTSPAGPILPAQSPEAPSTKSRPLSSATATTIPSQYQDPVPIPLSRRSTRGSTSGFKRTMSNLFRRSDSGSERTSAVSLNDVTYNPSSDFFLQDGAYKKVPPTRDFIVNRSSNTTRSNSPPSPHSPPLEMTSRTKASTPMVPNSEQFLATKKTRASTGLFSGRIKFVTGAQASVAKQRSYVARSSSFDNGERTRQNSSTRNDQGAELEQRSVWERADAGTGVKARRMSLSLPDDFYVDVAELQNEYEYQSKLLGRHGKQLGKGATSKVRTMVRKGSPGEMYAVKEFRGRASKETEDDYVKKIKSEYSIAKSLHHPNIVETVRLCRDHGRWNHVMEFCSEGDLYSLVAKKYLNKPDRLNDCLCLFKQVVQGVSYLHMHGIAHRDIKLENLLVTSDSKLKITDFGVSEVFSGIHPGLREAGGQCGVNMGEVRLCKPGITGSLPYISPEVMAKEQEYDPRALDVWSVGIVMVHLIFGGCIWGAAEPSNAQWGQYTKSWATWTAKFEDPTQAVPVSSDNLPGYRAFKMINPPSLRLLLTQMLNPDPKARITIADVVSKPWFKRIECCQLESYDDPARYIDASKKDALNSGNQRKIFCHNHLPPKTHNTHSLGKMPGSAGY